MNLIFNLDDDTSLESRVMSKDEILSYVSESEIYELVFGFKPVEYDKVCSPFRADFSPGAYFEEYNGKLYFKDWGHPGKTHRDCFNAVQEFYHLPNFFETLGFVRDHLIIGKELTRRQVVKNPIKLKERTSIIFQSRTYLISDKTFWERYKITKQNLIEDRVLPVTRYKMFNTKNGDISNFANTLCYAYTDFLSGNKKLYFPYRKGSKRFLTNCSKNDIGGINKLDLKDPQLIITKSYKDYRVLKNLGYNPVWFQNEGMIPDDEYLLPLINHFQDIIIFYDNDETGVIAANKLATHIYERTFNNPLVLHLPLFLLSEGIKDPSDMIYKKGEEELLNFLQTNI